jgi:hypothetical protein
MTGAFRAAWYAINEANRRPMSLNAALIDALRTSAREGDPFIYMHCATCMRLMKLSVPMFLKDGKGAAAAAAATASTVVSAFPPDMRSWSIDTVCRWVGTQSFSKYRSGFRDALVCGDVLADITDSDLIELGVTSGLHRKAVLSAINRFCRPPVASSTATAAGGGVSGVGAGLPSPQLLRGDSTSTAPRLLTSADSTFADGAGGSPRGRSFDVFISYRRVGGGAFAHLLRVLVSVGSLRVWLMRCG